MKHYLEEYHTFYDYMKKAQLTASEEDYLEMIYRLILQGEQEVRVNELASSLNITPPSVTKMIKKLKDKELIQSERYGKIQLTHQGYNIACGLLARHEIIYSFLEIIGVTRSILEETEKMEHTMSSETISHLEELVTFFNENQEIYQHYQRFKKRQ